MTISALDIVVIAAYLLAVLGLGLYQAFKIKSSGDYYAGGRKFNKFYLMMHALGTATHADEPLSVIGGAYQKGIAGIWYTYLFLPLTPIFWLIAPYIRRTRFVTTADFFRYRYDASLAVLYSIVGVLKMSVSIGLILKSTATLFSAMVGGGREGTKVLVYGINIEVWAILVMTVVFVSYGFAGGLRATVVTETIQGPLIVLMSLLLLPFGLYKLGGFAALHEALPASFFSLGGHTYEFSWTWVAASSLTALVGWVAQPGIVAAVGSGKTELEGRVGYTYGAMIKRVCAIGWAFTGVILAAMAAKNMLPPEQVQDLARRELAFGTAVRVFFPHGVLGLVFAAIFSSQMATLSAQMVNSSALASRNLYQALLRPTASDREVLIFGRICGIFLVAIGVMLSLALAKVADALTMLLQFSAIMGVVVWGGVLWRRANSYGAWASVATLFTLWVLFGPVGALLRKTIGGPAWLGEYGAAEYMFPLTIRYLPAGVAMLIVVSLLTPPPPRKQVDDFRMLLRTPVGEEQKLIDANVRIIYAGSTTPNRWEIEHPHLVHWGGAAVAAVACAIILALLLVLARIGELKVVTRDHIATTIRSLGVRPGDLMIAHSSYKSFGGVEGGPRAVAEALVDVASPGGSAFVPTFTYGRDVFDPATSPSHDGVITEMFRTLPGALRSHHPTHALAGVGPEAAAILDGHECVEPFGVGSPVWRLWERDAWVLLIGVGHFANSMAHVAEELLAMPHLDRTRVALVRRSNGSQKIRVRRPGCSDAWDAVLAPALASKVREQMVGESRFQLMRSRDVVDATVELLRGDPRALLCDRPECEACLEARALLG